MSAPMTLRIMTLSFGLKHWHSAALNASGRTALAQLLVDIAQAAREGHITPQAKAKLKGMVAAGRPCKTVRAEFYFLANQG